jgi:hypothetical protein
MSTFVSTDRTWFTVSEIADRYRCGPEKVLGWLRSGELSGVNIAARVGGKKPRWRISAEALANFERRRSAVPPSETGPNAALCRP